MTRPIIHAPVRTPDPPGFWWQYFGKDQWCRSVDYPELECLGDGAARRFRVNGIPMADQAAARAALHADAPPNQEPPHAR